jgi:DIS3-like exonuclease 2
LLNFFLSSYFLSICIFPLNLPCSVHIADVSYFLREGTPLDEEAQRRATSIYLVQKVIPMLPSILCEQLCSLNPNVDRLAFSCIWRMQADGTLCKEEPWFGRTVIRSCAKLDYPTAQRMIDGLIPSRPADDPADPDAFLKTISEEIWESKRHPIGHAAWACARDVCLMHSVAMNRRESRLSNGALVLNTSKLAFKLDEHGNPVTTTTYTIRDSNKLVEEYMLLANYLVAQEMIVRNGLSAFLRNHPPPKANGLFELQLLAEHIGMPIDITSAQTLQDSLKAITDTSDPLLSKAVTALLMHPMNLAKYFIADTCSSEEWRHYALSIPYYTHFTSPIRR